MFFIELGFFGCKDTGFFRGVDVCYGVRGLFYCLFHVERVHVLVLSSVGAGVLLLVFHVGWGAAMSGFSRVRVPYIEIVA